MRFLEGQKIVNNGGKLLIDIYLKPYDIGSMRYRKTEDVTYKKISEIISLGYRECIGFKNELAYWRMPIYIKFHNFKKCENYREGWTDEYGTPVDPDNFNGMIYP